MIFWWFCMINASIFDNFASHCVELDATSHQNRKKIKRIQKKGPILDPFWSILRSKSESQMQLRFGVDFWWISYDFEDHFRDRLIAFCEDFWHWRKLRFWWPLHAKSMILETEKHETPIKIESVFALNSWTDFWSETVQNLVKNN